jgi:multidrug efflux pump
VQLSTAIIFGLGFSTLLTLILVPVMLHLPDYLRERFSGLRRAPDIRQAMGGGDTPAE